MSSLISMPAKLNPSMFSISESWYQTKGKAHIHHNLIHIHPEDAVTMYSKSFGLHLEALEKLRKVIHYKIDHGHYEQTNRTNG